MEFPCVKRRIPYEAVVVKEDRAVSAYSVCTTAELLNRGSVEEKRLCASEQFVCRPGTIEPKTPPAPGLPRLLTPPKPNVLCGKYENSSRNAKVQRFKVKDYDVFS